MSLSLAERSQPYKQSLTFNTLANMALRLALVVLTISGISYWHLMSQLASDTQAQLLGYITERGQREETVFVLAEDNHALLRRDFLEVFTAETGTDWSAQFERRFHRWSDGSRRNVPEGTPPDEFDTEHHPTSFVQPDVELDADLQKRLVLSYDLIERDGAGWRDRFLNTYMSFPEGAATTLWPGAAWGLVAPADLEIPAEEWAYLGDRAHNPDRRTLWTGVYADPVTEQWMVSAITPVDAPSGRHLASIGHDVILTELLARALDDRLEGAYNLLVRADGQLIAEPHLMSAIQAEAGQLTVQTAGDRHLERIFDLARQTAQPHRVVYNAEDREYLAIAQLRGPDWYLITVYPETLLQTQALDATWFLLGLGLVSLVLEVVLLFVVLRQKVAAPLQDLLMATQQVTAGEFAVSLDTDRQDELGQLATSFTDMTQQLQTAFTDLEHKIAEQQTAEEIILDKTRALEQALQELQQMQLQTVQNEKMAALGDLVAGVAHEINNPIGFLNGSIKNARDYLNDLLAHLDVYQTAQPPNETVQESAEAIDLEFLREDVPKLLDSMQVATDRIKGISTNLRTFSRADTEYKVKANLHDGLESTLLILKYRLKANDQRPAIEVIRNYGQLPEIECFPGQLNQVFMNILANAIDMFDEVAQGTAFAELKERPQQIAVTTAVLPEGEAIAVQIADNGTGMSEAIQAKIFDNWFTTKAVGKGTGLGMAIAQQIVVEKHGGTITCDSELGRGTTFAIQLPVVDGASTDAG